MPYRPDLIYRYDGSFEGLLCCVFESYDKKEMPKDIVWREMSQTSFYQEKDIVTELCKSDRVLKSIPKKMGASALDFVRRAFLTCLAGKEMYILKFLRIGFRRGASVMDMLADDTVNRLFRAVKYLNNESHLLKGFIRFSDFNGALVAEIEPENYVLPLLSQHFCERYPEEHFLIYDKAHHMALVYEPYRHAIIPLDSLELPQPDGAEVSIQELWRLFYSTVEIQSRHNPGCRMSHMPKRYWKYMTEFGCFSGLNEKLMPFPSD